MVRLSLSAIITLLVAIWNQPLCDNIVILMEGELDHYYYMARMNSMYYYNYELLGWSMQCIMWVIVCFKIRGQLYVIFMPFARKPLCRHRKKIQSIPLFLLTSLYPKLNIQILFIVIDEDFNIMMQIISQYGTCIADYQWHSWGKFPHMT